MECNLTLGRVATAARHRVHAAQCAGLLPWASADEGVQHDAANEFDGRATRASAWEATPPARRRQEAGAGLVVPDPRHEVQAEGGLADFWYLDDGDILCDPRLVQPFLASFDSVNPNVGAERNVSKTEVIYFTSKEELEAHAEELQLSAVQALAAVSTADDAGLTLGVATRASSAVEEQLASKTGVVQAMTERVGVCYDVQTEYALTS